MDYYREKCKWNRAVLPYSVIKSTSEEYTYPLQLHKVLEAGIRMLISKFLSLAFLQGKGLLSGDTIFKLLLCNF